MGIWGKQMTTECQWTCTIWAECRMPGAMGKPQLEKPAFHIEKLEFTLKLCFWFQVPANAYLRRQHVKAQILMSLQPTWDTQIDVPRCWLWPSPALAISGVWRVSQCVQHLSLTLYLSLSPPNKVKTHACTHRHRLVILALPAWTKSLWLWDIPLPQKFPFSSLLGHKYQWKVVNMKKVQHDRATSVGVNGFLPSLFHYKPSDPPESKMH